MLKPNLNVMHEGLAYHLISQAEELSYGETWWCRTILVDHPELKLVLFKTLFPPKELHTKGATK